MKVFVSTKQTQGHRKNDFSWVPENELVIPSMMECDGESIDGTCGCKRSLVGIKCNKSTTTFKVIDMPGMDRPRLIQKIRTNVIKGGWGSITEANVLDEQSESFADWVIAEALRFSVGDVLEKRGEWLRERKLGDIGKVVKKRPKVVEKSNHSVEKAVMNKLADDVANSVLEGDDEEMD